MDTPIARQLLIGTADTVVTTAAAATVGAVLAAAIPPFGITALGGALFCGTIAGVTSLANTTLTTLFGIRETDVEIKFAAAIISCGTGIAAGVAICCIAAIPLTLMSGFSLLVACFVTVVVACLIFLALKAGFSALLTRDPSYRSV